MAIDNARKRAAAMTAMVPISFPSVRPDGTIAAFDRFQIFWSFRAAAVGTLTFYATTLENGVDANVFDGVTLDDSGNLRVRGDIYEGSAT
jgi:hypothetical protein